jgi:hypothetical protein
VYRHPYLAEISCAGRPTGMMFGLVQYRQQYRYQQAQDGYHYQQLDKCKAGVPLVIDVR